MAYTTEDTGSPLSGLYSFFANPPATSAMSYPAMEARRKIALQLIANSGKKGYPKTLGEGLSAIGDAIGERSAMRALQQQEAAYQQQAVKAAAGAVPGEALPGGKSDKLSEAGTDQPTVMSYAPNEAVEPADDPVKSSDASTSPDDGGYNFIDAQAGGRFKPTPGYLQDAITAREPNPDMQAYFGSLSTSEAKGPRDVSPTGAAGPYQFTRGTGAQYGIPGDQRFDPGASTDAARQLTADNADTFQRINGRAPTFAELALMHQQGGTTGAQMAAGTGNAPPGNLSVNNIPANASPAQAVSRINRFYGMPGETAPVAPAKGSYPPTASLGNVGGVLSDAPPIGMTPRDVIARQLLTAPEVPQPNPMVSGPTAPTTPPSTLTRAGSPPEAANNRPIVSDIAPMPVPGAQMAQGPPPAVPRAPLTDLPQRPTPPPVTVAPPPPRVPLPQDLPMSEDEKRGYRMQARALALGDPYLKQQADSLIQYGATQRKQQYDAVVQDYRDQMLARHQKELADEAFTRGAPERELVRKEKEIEIAKAGAFGGLDQGELFKEIAKSADTVKTIPAAQGAIKNALAVAPQMFTGATADVNLSLSKLMAASGFPADPRIPASEQFKAMISPVLASARQALVGGANISDSDMRIAKDAVGGNITLDAKTIPQVLASLDRMNVAMAVNHQRKLEAMAGDDPQRQSALFGVYGLPMENVVPRAAVDLLKSRPTPEVVDQFNKKYHTPGLAQRMLGGGG